MSPDGANPRAQREGAVDLQSLIERQRAAFARDPWPSAAVRRGRLSRLTDVVADEAAWVAAIDRDFGHRSAHETRLAELYVVAAEARLAMRRLSRRMKPRPGRPPRPP